MPKCGYGDDGHYHLNLQPHWRGKDDYVHEVHKKCTVNYQRCLATCDAWQALERAIGHVKNSLRDGRGVSFCGTCCRDEIYECDWGLYFGLYEE